MLLNADGRALRAFECALPLRITDAPGGALVVDALEERVFRLSPRGAAAVWAAPVEPLDAAVVF